MIKIGGLIGALNTVLLIIFTAITGISYLYDNRLTIKQFLT